MNRDAKGALQCEARGKTREFPRRGRVEVENCKRLKRSQRVLGKDSVKRKSRRKAAERTWLHSRVPSYWGRWRGGRAVRWEGSGPVEKKDT